MPAEEIWYMQRHCMSKFWGSGGYVCCPKVVSGPCCSSAVDYRCNRTLLCLVLILYVTIILKTKVTKLMIAGSWLSKGCNPKMEMKECILKMVGKGLLFDIVDR